MTDKLITDPDIIALLAANGLASEDNGATFTAPVTVPVPTVPGHAVRVVAFDPAIGRYAVQGPNGVIEQGDTGRRLITPTTGWTGDIYLSRDGNIVTLASSQLAGDGGSTTIVTLPSGFSNPATDSAVLGRTGGTSGIQLLFTTPTTLFTQASSTADLRILMSWKTTDAWPVSLPGVAA